MDCGDLSRRSRIPGTKAATQSSHSKPRCYAFAIRTILAFLIGVLAAHPLSALDPARALTHYVHDAWRTDEGLPQATVRAIVQTRDGYLWIGTEEGLARFDGVRFTLFNRSNVAAIRENHVLALLEDTSGNLWIGTHGGGLIRYRAGAFETFGKRDGIASEFVYALYEDRAGTLWIGCRGGMTRLRGGKFTAAPAAGGTVWSILQDQSNVMWVGSDLHGLGRIERGPQLQKWDARNGLHDGIPALCQLRDGRVIAGTNGGGLHEWNGARFVPFRANGTLPDNAITALYEDAAGNLWIGTSGGLARATSGAITTFPSGDLAHNPISAIAEDAEGSLWIGTIGAGLHRLRDGKVHTLTTADGLPGNSAQTVFHDRDGATWIGTRTGLARIANGAIATWSARNGLPNASVKSLFQSADGTIWIGTDLGGVVRFKGGTMQTTILDAHIPDNTVRAFAEQPGVGVWAGTNGGRLTLFVNGVPARRIGPEKVFVRAMVANGSSLWVATDGNGLLHFVDGVLRKRFTERDGLSRDSLRSLHIDAKGIVWIGTDGGGLNRLENDTISVFTTHEGLFDDVVLQILEGDDGRLWMSSNNGIFAADKRAFEMKSAWISSFVINDRDGMLSRDCSGGSQPAGAKSRDGRLWFPTNEGVVVVDPKHLRINRRPPPVVIEKVVADDVVTGGELPRGARNVEISYTALTFVVPERVRFRYKLEGHDEHWIDAGARRTAYYTTLAPGTYRFRVIAANDDDVWNETGATMSVTLPPYFYQRSAFLYLLVALIIAASWLGVAMRIRRVRRDAANMAEMERQFVLVQRMDALGQMASGIAHDFNNTLMAAYPWAELIRLRYPNDPMLQRAAENITNAVERAKKVTSQLLDFAHPKPPHSAPMNVGDVARDALSMARPMIPREIDVELVVDREDVIATGDEAKIAQVLLNLLLNARDAMPNGGHLRVEVRAPAGEPDVVLSVIDTGRGMEPHIRERIFDPFFTTKGVGKGTGLGLAVAHRIVQDHGGTIRVESTLGEGSAFHIRLPKATAVFPVAAPRIEREVEPLPLQGTKVLLVDDEAVIVAVVRELLHAEGATVIVAHTGAEALQHIDEAGRPDLVILDLGLPGMSGERVHALLRERFADLPIIISSGYGDHERLDPLLRDPHTSYFQKPYRIGALIEKVRLETLLPPDEERTNIRAKP